MIATRLAARLPARLPAWLACVALVVGASGSCARSADRQNVETLRRHYRATLLGFMVLDALPGTTPAVNEQKDHASPAARPAAAQANGEGLIDPPLPTSDIELRVELQHDSPVKLASLTLEVELLGPEGDDVERQHYRVLVNTAGIEPGPAGEVRSVLKEVPYAAGERFHVFVRPDVPSRERGLYSEFLSSR